MNAISNKRVEVVLDPSFLFNFMDKAVRPKEKCYILVYGVFSQQMIERILSYAHFTGKKTISISYGRPWCDLDLDTLSPFQWLGYFANCDCVITTMYHGMIYAILNQKEFCMFRTPYRKNKLGDLPQALGISNRILDEDVSIEDVFKEKIDYSKVNPQVQKFRCRSERFLLEALQS